MVHDSLCYGEAWVVGIPPPLHVGWDGGHIMPWGPRPCLSSSSSLLLTVQPRYHYPPLLLLPECITILSTPPTHIPLPPPPRCTPPAAPWLCMRQRTHVTSRRTTRCTACPAWGSRAWGHTTRGRCPHWRRRAEPGRSCVCSAGGPSQAKAVAVAAAASQPAGDAVLGVDGYV